MKLIWLFGIGVFVSGSVLCQSKQVVFVCEHGSAKSIIAATYFNKLAGEKNLNWVAVSRGTNPDVQVSPRTIALLKSENLFDNSLVPTKIEQADVDAAQQVILFYPLPGEIRTGNKTRSWLEVKATNDDYKKLRDDIVSRLIPLIDSLAKR